MATALETLNYSRVTVWQAQSFEEFGQSAVTANTTLTSDGPRVLDVNPSGGAIVLTLPASPYAFMTYTVQEVAGSANLITVNGNGNNILGSPTYVMNAPYRVRVFQYRPAVGAIPAQWYIVGGAN